MGKKLESITSELKSFIEEQKMFFVGTASEEGRVNVSPKGTDSFRVLNENKVVWLNLTGSGNETAAHLIKMPRMTIMFCAFEGKPMILRLYGTAKVYHMRDKEFHNYIELFPANPGSRQVIEMHIDLVQTSCGFAVPLLTYKEDRTILTSWAEKQGSEGIEEYWETKNTRSLDGYKTNILNK